MFILVRGANIYYEQHGDGPDVLLLHGWGCSTELFAPIARELSRHMRVTMLDFAGHGRSGMPPEPWGALEFAEMAADVVETLGIIGCDVIGHSHGGRVALTLAAKRPELVRNLVLTGASGLRAEPTKRQKRRAARYKRLRGVSDALESARVFGSWPERFREALRMRYGSKDYRVLDAEMRRTFVKLVNFNVDEILPDVKASTLLIWGDADEETPLWMGRRMEARIPDAGLVVLPGSHYVYLEQKNRFLTIAQHFLLGGHE
ncbi:MAG: alpha/beta hydrolase [Clostridia bacterium]|nr:alpha/beta hydrolase [Clostridia bacterium]